MYGRRHRGTWTSTNGWERFSAPRSLGACKRADEPPDKQPKRPVTPSEPTSHTNSSSEHPPTLDQQPHRIVTKNTQRDPGPSQRQWRNTSPVQSKLQLTPLPPFIHPTSRRTPHSMISIPSMMSMSIHHTSTPTKRIRSPLPILLRMSSSSSQNR